MSKDVHENVFISQKMAQRYRTQSNKRLEHAASSDGAGENRLWSVVLRGQSLFLVFVVSSRL